MSSPADFHPHGGDREFLVQQYFGAKLPVRKVEYRRDDASLVFLHCRCGDADTHKARCCMTRDIEDMEQPLIIAVDGGYRKDHAFCTIGVFAGQDSEYNASQVLRFGSERPSSNLAEAAAAIQGLRVAHRILQERLQAVETVIIKSDCLNVIDAVVGEQFVYTDVQRYRGWDSMLDAEQARLIEEAIRLLEAQNGVKVYFWWVPREDNLEADQLVRNAMLQEIVKIRAPSVEETYQRRLEKKMRREATVTQLAQGMVGPNPDNQVPPFLGLPPPFQESSLRPKDLGLNDEFDGYDEHDEYDY